MNYLHLEDNVMSNDQLIENLLKLQRETGLALVENFQDPNVKFKEFYDKKEYQKAIELCYTILTHEFCRIQWGVISVDRSQPISFEWLINSSKLAKDWYKRMTAAAKKVKTQTNSFVLDCEDNTKIFSDGKIKYLLWLYGSTASIDLYNKFMWLFTAKSKNYGDIYSCLKSIKLITPLQRRLLNILIWNHIYNSLQIDSKLSSKLSLSNLSEGLRWHISKLYSLRDIKDKKKK